MMLEHCQCSILYTASIRRFPLASHVAGLPAPAYTVAVPAPPHCKSPTVICVSPQCDPQFAPVLLSFYEATSCISLREVPFSMVPLLVPSGRTQLWPKSHQRPQEASAVPWMRAERRRWLFSFFIWTLRQPWMRSSWKPTYLLPLLHSQDNPDLGIMLRNQPCLLACLCLFHLSPAVC